MSSMENDSTEEEKHIDPLEIDDVEYIDIEGNYAHTYMYIM